MEPVSQMGDDRQSSSELNASAFGRIATKPPFVRVVEPDGQAVI
jgi:hypothetical protein